jgi:hypothetical protein
MHFEVLNLGNTVIWAAPGVVVLLRQGNNHQSDEAKTGHISRHCIVVEANASSFALRTTLLAELYLDDISSPYSGII